MCNTKRSLPIAFTAKPPFTYADLKKAIPAHCFERSYVHSFLHVAMDLFVAYLLFTAATLIPSDGVLPWLLWPTYWVAQGAVLTGVWVLAHECGHQAFSPSKTVNDITGLVLHSALLVPYHSWRISHGKHHSSTGSIEHDEVFVPAHASEVSDAPPSPIVRAGHIFMTLTVGWPGYLLFNAAGPKKYKGKPNSHFNPKSALFGEKDYNDVVVSDIFLAAWVAFLVYLSYTYSFSAVVFFYGIPYLNVNFWLVLITYLQHSDSKLPHYRSAEWTWLRGALATVDRSYGTVLNHVHHHIADTHVCHHIFPKIPHYHAQEATEAIKKVLGEYYISDDTPIAKALWTSFYECRFVDDVGDVLPFKTWKEADPRKYR